jgi:serine/threonine-protein kinase
VWLTSWGVADLVGVAVPRGCCCSHVGIADLVGVADLVDVADLVGVADLMGVADLVGVAVPCG